jgi:hypothetical protein
MLLALEITGVVAMCSLVPFAWLWLGGQVYTGTHSLALDGAVAFFGFVATTVVLLRSLASLDTTWMDMRRRQGHEQEEGALPRIVVIAITLTLVAFMLWYYLFSSAYVLPFMPAQ